MKQSALLPYSSKVIIVCCEVKQLLGNMHKRVYTVFIDCMHDYVCVYMCTGIMMCRLLRWIFPPSTHQSSRLITCVIPHYCRNRLTGRSELHNIMCTFFIYQIKILCKVLRMYLFFHTNDFCCRFLIVNQISF